MKSFKLDYNIEGLTFISDASSSDEATRLLVIASDKQQTPTTIRDILRKELMTINNDEMTVQELEEFLSKSFKKLNSLYIRVMYTDGTIYGIKDNQYVIYGNDTVIDVETLEMYKITNGEAIRIKTLNVLGDGFIYIDNERINPNTWEVQIQNKEGEWFYFTQLALINDHQLLKLFDK